MKQLDIFKKSPLFSCLNDQEILALAEIAVEGNYSKDTVLINEGDTTTSLYVLLSGRAHAVSIDAHGNRIIHNVFTSGDYFGEMSFIDGEPRCATVETSEPSTVLIIPREQFRNVLLSHPDISVNLMKGLLQKIRKATKQIEDLVFVVAHQELHDAHLDTIKRLVLAAEYKDQNTGEHIARVSRYSALIAKKLRLSKEDIQIIRYAAPMHDVGKIGIPDHILLKPDKLTDEEFNIMRTHTTIGAKILSNPRSNVLKCARQIALSHHERFDGTGYPEALFGNKIPIVARIVGLVDTFDALISERPYKGPYSVEGALDIIKKERGEHFDPHIADIFIKSIEEILTINEELSLEQNKLLPEFIWNEGYEKALSHET